MAIYTSFYYSFYCFIILFIYLFLQWCKSVYSPFSIKKKGLFWHISPIIFIRDCGEFHKCSTNAGLKPNKNAKTKLDSPPMELKHRNIADIVSSSKAVLIVSAVSTRQRNATRIRLISAASSQSSRRNPSWQTQADRFKRFDRSGLLPCTSWHFSSSAIVNTWVKFSAT